MREVPCEVIRDLLPLYVDGVCSEKSKKMVDEHLKTCEDCQKYLESIQEEIPEVVMPEREGKDSEVIFLEDVFKKIKKKLKTSRAMAVGVTLAVVGVFYMLLGGNGYLSGVESELIDLRLKTEDVRVTELYQLESGEIFCTLESDKKVSWTEQTLLAHDGNLTETADFYAVAELKYSLWSERIEQNAIINKCSFVYPLKGATGYDQKIRNISNIFYIGKDEKRLVIWKEGQEIQKAPAHIEQLVEEERIRQRSEDNRHGLTIYY